MFTDAELSVLKKFETGGNVETPSDRELLERAALIGMVRFGMTFVNGKVVSQACLTQKGETHLHESELAFCK